MKLDGVSSNQIQQLEINNRTVEAGFDSSVAVVSSIPSSESLKTNNSLLSDNNTINGSRKVSEKALTNAIKDFNKSLADNGTKLEISVFKPTHELQVKIKDNKTGKVIREIPSQKMLELGLYMRKMAGLIVDTKI